MSDSQLCSSCCVTSGRHIPLSLSFLICKMGANIPLGLGKAQGWWQKGVLACGYTGGNAICETPLAGTGHVEGHGLHLLHLCVPSSAPRGRSEGLNCPQGPGVSETRPAAAPSSCVELTLSCFPAGHETSANHLAFTVMELSRQPEILARYGDGGPGGARLPLMLVKGFV